MADGLWQVVVGDVMVPARTVLTQRRRLRAAVLATEGLLSHSSAARLWDLPVPDHDEPALHVTVAVAAHPRVAGVRVHRRNLATGDRGVLHGLPLTSRPRTVADCVSTWPPSAAANLLDHVLRTRVVPVHEMGRLVADAKGTHGVGQLRRLVQSASGGSWSAAERRLHRLLRAAGIHGWVANKALRLAHGRRVVVDVWFEEARLAVEIDGQAWHVGPERFQRDRERQNALVLSGCTVLRFTWADLTQSPGQVIAEIQAALSRTYGRVRPENGLTRP